MNLKSKKLQHADIVSIYLVIYDVITIACSFLLGLWIRYDCVYSNIPENYLTVYCYFMPIYIVACLLIYYLHHLYRTMWRYASAEELLWASASIVFALFVNVIGCYVCCKAIVHTDPMPMSYFWFGTLLQFGFTVGIRFAYRFVNLVRSTRSKSESGSLRPVMLFGAGDAARLLMQDMNQSKKLGEKICCILDDNPNKWGRFIDGIQIEGGRESILACVKKYNIEKIYVAIPSASQKQIRDILNICKESGCELFNMPSLYKLYTGEISMNFMKEVQVEELLGREPISIKMESIYNVIKDKVVLVTGGGGSIGSEICRQVAEHEPKQIIIFDIYENNAYDIQLEIKKNYPHIPLECIIGSVRDSRKVFELMEVYKPQIIFHAAAHKHVPLMEDSPCEAIKNNAIGTYKTAFAAMVHGCERFVLISTDKAVNPTNIMGASKRICEMIVQTFDAKIKAGKAQEIPQLFIHESEIVGGSSEKVLQALRNSKTEFVAVRFGNVLGSNGSVIPLFKKQIAQGGPVTVTHPEIIRYFMTIPEAVSLVLQAASDAQGGEIFVLDMGDPVKIDDLARNLIKLSGHKPDEDIKIVYTGLRPGEKLYEEKLMAEEGLKKTDNDLIHIGCPIAFDMESFLLALEDLMEAAYQNKSNIREQVAKIVPTYKI